MRLVPSTFHDVAQHLRAQSCECVDDTWDRIANARCRTTRSRAYYAVFLAIKDRVTTHRATFRFPEEAVHATVLNAVRHVFDKKSRISLVLSSLIDQRKDADYELDGLDDPYVGIDSTVTNARFALDEISRWRSEQIEEMIAAIQRHRIS